VPILTRLIGRVKRKEQERSAICANECVQFALNECVQFAGRHARRAEELERARAHGHQARGARTLELGDRCELIVSEATVESHVASILRKLGLRDRVQVVIRAYESGLVEPGDH